MSRIIILDLSHNRVNRKMWDDKGGILNLDFSHFRAACDDTYFFVFLRQGIHSRYTTSLFPSLTACGLQLSVLKFLILHCQFSRFKDIFEFNQRVRSWLGWAYVCRYIVFAITRKVIRPLLAIRSTENRIFYETRSAYCCHDSCVSAQAFCFSGVRDPNLAYVSSRLNS